MAKDKESMRKTVRVTESRNKEPKALAKSQEGEEKLVHFLTEHVLMEKNNQDSHL